MRGTIRESSGCFFLRIHFGYRLRSHVISRMMMLIDLPDTSYWRGPNPGLTLGTGGRHLWEAALEASSPGAGMLHSSELQGLHCVGIR